MNINNELGISLYNDYYSETGYANAGGKGWKKVGKIAWAVLSPGTAIAYRSLSNNDKKRYKEVMGSASNPQSNKIKHFDNDIVKLKFPFDSNMSTEKLADIIDEMNNEYNRYDTDRDSKAAAVAKNNKSFSVEPNRGLIAQLQDIRAMMQAINDHRARVVKAYNIAVAREEKAAIEAEEKAAEAAAKTQTQKTTGLPLPPVNVGAQSNSMIEAGSATIGETTMGGEPQGTSGLFQGDINVGGKPVKKSTIGIGVGVLVAATIGYFVLRRN